MELETKVSYKSHPSKFNSTGNLVSVNSQGGLLQTPPSRFLSANSFHSHQYHHPFIHLQQPPLLPSPSPILQRAHRSLPSQARSQSLNPRKSISTKREQEPKQGLKSAIDHSWRQTPSDDLIIKAWKNHLNNRNHKSNLAGDASGVSSVSSPSPPNKRVVVTAEDFDKLSGYLFTISPPPSSLPLPKFSLRSPKLNCNVEAAGVDTGATDDLRRLLRLP